ncbi:orotidine-5'-phosphate decarboxylase [Hymenobacter latericus]|uniref:orotidine-5'-phosphate decarboxylase n=1 Tax=Hymenobacter sp. YIM 151858-1 TaxID=2987688 RepID=UPI002226DFAC|nr:orotidine-5'-phosphate decarboxylase [Hymenobacter sp. YIM 151858-1]UYZ57928.1 orotidine-5'-phosphate decarboxylase [Hymenobacter sp. YIM 151858-1]
MDQLTRRAHTTGSLLCVGLDPVGENVETRLRQVVEQTAEYAAGFKPNLAFFLARPDGVALLQRLREWIPSEVPMILDGKFGDIANTAERYAAFAYDIIGADGVTVNPYMGDDAIVPFARPGKAVFVLAKTSNKPAHSLQDEQLVRGGTLSDLAADVVQDLYPQHPDLGLVVGATNAEALARLRQRCPELWFLVPGVGAQGGDLAATVQAGCRPSDGLGLLINTSRSIWQAADAGAAARDLTQQIHALRSERFSAAI